MAVSSRSLLLFCCFISLLFLSFSSLSSTEDISSDLDLELSELEGLETEDLDAEESPTLHSHSDEHLDEEGHESSEEAYEDEEDDYGDEEDDEPFGAPVDDADVVVLTAQNFTDFIKSNHYAMVEFYAPWCGHCQALAPEYAAAATLLKEEHQVPLAKVDATSEHELAQTYDVQGYPTLLFFVDGVQKPYTSQRTKDGIVGWVKKRVGPSTIEVSSVDDAEAILEAAKTIVVAFFENFEGPEFEEYTSAARKEDEITFYQTKSEDVAHVFNIQKGSKAPALVLLKNTSEKVIHFNDKFENEKISEFVLGNKLPLVTTFNRESASSIFDSPIKKQLLLFVNPEDHTTIFPIFEEAAKAFKGKIIFVHVDSSDEDVGKPILEFFGVNKERPTIVGFSVAAEQSKKFLFHDEISVDKIKVFGDDLLADKLKQFYKSEPVPEKNDSDVKVVVGDNLDEIVLDESKDVLLEIYAPWCGHCQALEPTYNKLGRILRSVDSLVIAKMDGTTNEHPRAKADGFPTILFFPAGSKSFDPITVDTERTLKALYLFLKKNAAIPFTLPKTVKKSGEEVKSDDADGNSSEHLRDEL